MTLADQEAFTSIESLEKVDLTNKMQATVYALLSQFSDCAARQARWPQDHIECCVTLCFLHRHIKLH